jgi:predicted RNA-binding protein with RPS1 domain
VLQLGDEIEVKIIEIDPQGKVRLSRTEGGPPQSDTGPRRRSGDRRGGGRPHRRDDRAR